MVNKSVVCREMTGAADACVDKDIFIYECFDLIPDGLVELVSGKQTEF